MTRLPEVWASVCSLAEAAGLGEGALPEIGWSLVMVQSQAAATARQRKRPDRAREIVAGLEEFTRGLVARFPRDAWSHLAMSEAQCQKAKNAWRVPGFVGLRGATRLALEAARRACELDPRNEEGAGDAHREAATRGTPAPGCVLRTRRVPLLALVLHGARAA